MDELKTSKRRLLTRRNFLRALLVGAVVEGGCEYFGLGPISRMNHSLEHVAAERDGLFYRGFPTRTRNAEFEIGELVRRGSDIEVIIFNDAHYPEIWRREAKLIDFLVEEHGFDSIGLEGFYGEPRKTMAEDSEREFSEFLEGTDKIVDERDENKGPIVVVSNPAEFRKFLRQESVPTYGIENRDHYFSMVALQGVGMCVDYIGRYLREIGDLKAGMMRRLLDGEKRIWKYEDIPNIAQLERFFDVVKRKFPDVPFPGNTLKEMVENFKRGNERFMRYNDYFNDCRLKIGNAEMARNIVKNMEKLGSRKGIVVLGQAHNEDFEVYARRIQEGNFSKDYRPMIKKIRDLLEYNVLNVRASEELIKRLETSSVSE